MSKTKINVIKPGLFKFTPWREIRLPAGTCTVGADIAKAAIAAGVAEEASPPPKKRKSEPVAGD